MLVVQKGGWDSRTGLPVKQSLAGGESQFAANRIFAFVLVVATVVLRFWRSSIRIA